MRSLPSTTCQVSRVRPKAASFSVHAVEIGHSARFSCCTAVLRGKSSLQVIDHAAGCGQKPRCALQLLGAFCAPYGARSEGRRAGRRSKGLGPLDRHVPPGHPLLFRSPAAQKTQRVSRSSQNRPLAPAMDLDWDPEGSDDDSHVSAEERRPAKKRRGGGSGARSKGSWSAEEDARLIRQVEPGLLRCWPRGCRRAGK